jgi:hypothetical protein
MELERKEKQRQQQMEDERIENERTETQQEQSIWTKDWASFGICSEEVAIGWVAISMFVYVFWLTSKPESTPTPKIPPATVTSVPAQSVPQATTGNTGCIGDCINGQGTLTYTSGDKYVGQFKNGQPDGQGTLFYINGNKYIGEFRKNIIDGQGVIIYANGDKYEGMLTNGMREGQGILTYANGGKYVGMWVNGEPVKNLSLHFEKIEI